MKRPLGILAAVLVAGCASEITRFPAAEPMLVDKEDFRTYSPPPDEHKAATIWDGVDEILFRPLPQLLKVDPAGRALNATALDEVADSSWFTNRWLRKSLTPQQAAQGACTKPIDPAGPFEVLSGKPDGWNPGFLVKAPDGRKYFFKFDQHELQPERMSMAEVIGSLIYSAAGFTVPCYEILYFDRKALVLSKGATVKNMRGEKVPMTEAFIDDAFKLVKVAGDGKVRSVASLLLEGKPLGPWQYSGTASDDPNDVVPHQERREVRAGYVIASWVSHFDTRDQNTLRTWIAEKGVKQGYVRHNILDFGDSLGNLSEVDSISRRLGYAYYLDFPYLAGDFATLGIVSRPWERVSYGPGGPVLGYFDVENFDPENWRPGYPNPAFQRLREADAGWMARILAELRDEHLDAMIERGKITDTAVRQQLRRTLIGRRDKLLSRWFSVVSPLAHPEVRGTATAPEVCLRDLALYAGTIGSVQRSYEARLRLPDLPDKVELTRLDGPPPVARRSEPSFRRVASAPAAPPAPVAPAPHLCARLPAKALEGSAYAVVEIHGRSTVNATERPLLVHLYRRDAVWHVAGLERPE